MALKNTQRNGPLKEFKEKKGYISILKNQQENHHQIKFLCSKIKAEFHLKSSP